MVNDPEGILTASEKTYSLFFPQHIPATCLTSRWEEMERFAAGQKTGVVLKPLHGAGGRGVFYFSRGDSNFRVAFELLTQNGTQYVLGQEYLSAVRQGDKRIMLLNGEILGYFNRIPQPGDHRANLHSGGRLAPCRLTAKEEAISRELGRALSKEGLLLVGLDLIGERLTEVNVTSPMGLNEINQTQKTHSEKRVIDFVESRL
jgi:glutathione synthase